MTTGNQGADSHTEIPLHIEYVMHLHGSGHKQNTPNMHPNILLSSIYGRPQESNAPIVRSPPHILLEIPHEPLSKLFALYIPRFSSFEELSL